MTLIAYHAHGDHAEILTDTLAYNGGGRRMAHNTKVHLIHHLDAALMTQGDLTFGSMVKMGLKSMIQEPTFDALVKAAPAELREAWKVATEGPARKIEGTVFLVGWSEEAEAFTGWRFAADDDFETHREDGPFLMPCPQIFRASDLELDRLAAEGVPSDVLDPWRQAAPFAGNLTPQSTEDWVTIGQAAHMGRSLAPNMIKVFIGGSLHLTRLERGKQTTERVHTFDTTGNEFALMVAGTLHPQSQASPCLCGSGERFVDCCLEPHLDQPCPCGTSQGKTIGECCAITAEETAQEVPAAS